MSTKDGTSQPESLLWNRLVACNMQIEHGIRRRLRACFGTTLPRFSYTAELARYPEGMRLTTLSNRLNVSGGNVTLLITQLVANGLVMRFDDAFDRRVSRVAFTARGRASFAAMADEHRGWLADMFADAASRIKESLTEQPGQLSTRLEKHANTETPS